MATRATFVQIADSGTSKELGICISPEFNGDGAPDMHNGEILYPKFATVRTVDEFRAFIDFALNLYGYDKDEYADEILKFRSIVSRDEKFTLDVGAFYKSWFNYSDYNYIINNSTQDVLLIGRDNSHLILKPNKTFVYHFGDYMDVQPKEIKRDWSRKYTIKSLCKQNDSLCGRGSKPVVRHEIRDTWFGVPEEYVKEHLIDTFDIPAEDNIGKETKAYFNEDIDEYYKARRVYWELAETTIDSMLKNDMSECSFRLSENEFITIDKERI